MSNFKKQHYIPELYVSIHRKDSNQDSRFQYENNLLRKSTSIVLWQNPKLNSFVSGLNWLLVHIVDSVCYLRNWYNINADKYYTDYRD